MNWHVSTVKLHFLRLQTLHQICSICGLYHQWRSEHQRPMTGWPLLIDIDAADPNNNGVDRCCWPSLDSLKALIGAEK
jgi:hypothetical protein